MYSREGMETSTQFYVTHFLIEEPHDPAKKGAAYDDTCEENHGVPAGRGWRGREMEVLDPVSFAQRTQTLQRSAATPAAGEPANAHHPIAGVRTDEGASPADLGARVPQGRIHTFGTRTEVGADASSTVCVGKVVLRAAWPGV